MNGYIEIYKYLKAYSRCLNRLVLHNKSHIPTILKMVPLKAPGHGIRANVFPEPITHISLENDNTNGIYTKMIVWNPMAEIPFHSHDISHCYFQALRPRLIQTMSENHKGEIITKEISTEEYTYFHKSMGGHRLVNQRQFSPNVSFHLYVRDEFDDYRNHIEHNEDQYERI